MEEYLGNVPVNRFKNNYIVIKPQMEKVESSGVEETFFPDHDEIDSLIASVYDLERKMTLDRERSEKAKENIRNIRHSGEGVFIKPMKERLTPQQKKRIVAISMAAISAFGALGFSLHNYKENYVLDDFTILRLTYEQFYPEAANNKEALNQFVMSHHVDENGQVCEGGPYYEYEFDSEETKGHSK